MASNPIRAHVPVIGVARYKHAYCLQSLHARIFRPWPRLLQLPVPVDLLLLTNLILIHSWHFMPVLDKRSWDCTVAGWISPVKWKIKDSTALLAPSNSSLIEQCRRGAQKSLRKSYTRFEIQCWLGFNRIIKRILCRLNHMRNQIWIERSLSFSLSGLSLSCLIPAVQTCCISWFAIQKIKEHMSQTVRNSSE